MTPGSRVSASIELLEQILPTLSQRNSTPVDAIIAKYFRDRRFMGSKDRGTVAANVYFILRHLSSLTWRLEQLSLPADARYLMLCFMVSEQQFDLEETTAHWAGDSYAPKRPNADEIKKLASLTKSYASRAKMPLYAATDMPEWLMPQLQEIFPENTKEELLALNEEAPVDLRANSLKATREGLLDELRSEGFDAMPTALSPWNIRLARRGQYFATNAFKDGWFEMQDEGSQIVALLCDAKPGQKVVDFCAGAGGKTLALAAMMKNKGRILALDIAEHRMKDLKTRMKRAGVDNAGAHVIESEIDPWLKRHKDSADVVLVDAPCTGTGTWRRNPDLKWRLTPEAITDLTALQGSILASAAKLVKSGGRLVYATCSILKSENEQQVEAFLQNRHDFKLVAPGTIWDNDRALGIPQGSPYLRLSPHQDGTDGFFAAVLERTA